MISFLLLTISLTFANDCPVQKKDFWSHYADEWGHDEKKTEVLKERNIAIGKDEAVWVYLPRTCSKFGCDVTFLLKLPKKDCWKPLVSIQGRIRSFKKGDWTRFKNTYLRSSVDTKKTAEQIWFFDQKEKTFRQELRPNSL